MVLVAGWLAVSVPILPQRTAAAAANDVPCARYVVIGVRGSGESMGNGRYGMGGKVDGYVSDAFVVLPAGERATYSLPYRAASPLDPIDFWRSMRDGATMLTLAIEDLVHHCPGVHIGLVGYSQGAGVIHNSLWHLDEPYLRAVRGVLLLADPLDAGPGTSYSISTNRNGDAGPHRGGGVWQRFGLPGEIEGRTHSFCITDDPVCDSPTGILPTLIGGLFSWDIHLIYGSCCETVRRLLGITLGYRLSDPVISPPTPPPGPPGPPPPGPPHPRHRR